MPYHHQLPSLMQSTMRWATLGVEVNETPVTPRRVLERISAASAL